MKSSSRIPVLQKITQSAPAIQSALPPLPTRQDSKYTPLPLCQKVPGMHFPLWTAKRVDGFHCRWRRSQSGSGEGMKTSIKCEDCNETSGFTHRGNCFYELHYMSSISIYSGGIWLDCGCVMCILKADQSEGPNLGTGKGIQI